MPSWTPCAHCPRTDDRCRGRRHPRDCQNVAAEIAAGRSTYWRDWLAANPDDGPVPGPYLSTVDRTPAAGRPRPAPVPPAPATATIAYLLNSAGICGGVRVVFEHLNGLVDRGHDVCLVIADGSIPPPNWVDVRFPWCSLAAARSSGLWQSARILVATHWTTAAPVAEGAGDGRLRFYFVQSREDWMDPMHAAEAQASYRLPLRPLACNTWVKWWLEGEFGHRNVPVVPQGVSAEFYPEPGFIR